MPFREIKGFDSETLRQMTQAFDAACVRLGLRADDPERDELAKVIVELAWRGERDPAMLFARAIEASENDFEL
ncbi:hypothetical protein [Rhodoplanes sp. Z2-YC6860]|uniref:hypothetical protein n=1 Tax=Rhodoplanes sp. Z2-YC6860 TaxID=674703 RepID=UPI00082DBACF|nr:hypothetical protein [Rhodoplanes sp. Z2-YC6860]